MRTNAPWLAASAAAVIATLAAGQASSPAPMSSRTAPAAAVGASEGAKLASQGAVGVAPCSGCHGAQGEGNAAAGFPRLAGQPAAYLLRQLEAYASDQRANPVMQPIAKAMTPAQRGAAAGYYESLAVAAARPASAAATTTAAAPPLGKSIATVGIQGRLVQACANCHGPEGVGEWATYPALAGQHRAYLANALAEWKSGARRTDPSEQMPRIAKLLTEAEANAVVAYYASLPPGSAVRASAEPTGAKPRQTVVSGPTQGPQTGSTQGVGTEQGAPLAGGTQGAGGPGSPTGPQSGRPTTGGGRAAPASGASAPR